MKIFIHTVDVVNRSVKNGQMEIENTKTIEQGNVKCLIAGPSGAGKTTTAGTLEGRTLIISGEEGLLPLAGKDIDVVNLSRKDGKILTDPTARIGRLSETFKWLHDGAPDAKGKPMGYRNIFLDSLTEISEQLVAKLNREFPDRKDSYPMWGEYGKMMGSIVRNFRDLPFNVFMSVLSKPEKDDVGKRYMGFDISGSIADRLPQYFDLVLFVHVDKDGKRSLITRSTDTLNCKDRSNRLDAQEQPDLGLIIRKIRGEKKQ